MFDSVHIRENTTLECYVYSTPLFPFSPYDTIDWVTGRISAIWPEKN